MPIVTEHLRDMLVARYGIQDDSDLDYSSAKEDTDLDSDELLRGYSGEELLHWPHVEER